MHVMLGESMFMSRASQLLWKVCAASHAT